MKRSILIIICLLSAKSWAQDTLSLINQKKGEITICWECEPILNCGPTGSQANPLFVFFIGNKRLLLDNDFNTRHGKDFFGLINPESIKKVIVVEGTEAINKYGDVGNNGVAEIWLKQGAVKNLPPEVMAEFKSLKDLTSKE